VKFIPWHIVRERFWPVITGVTRLTLTSSAAVWFKTSIASVIIIPSLTIVIIIFLWWRDIVRESTIIGRHTKIVQVGLKLGIILFIFSEVIFFFGFFWAFFHRSLSPIVERGITWPPFSINPINPIRVPLLNTALLLFSGVTVTWRHLEVVANNRRNFLLGGGGIRLINTLLLGFYFTVIQWQEYKMSTFSIRDGIFGRVFFIATGFHGIHVIIGSIFLLICLVRIWLKHFSELHHLGFELAIWYWHFVDVVWLFLFTTIYVWGY